tara:strand:- start:72 stop:308 length:237 start_codon:yes stop_codon:yes gene_type:complete
MFQLIAILVFFALGIAFFAIGKDDFGIKRIKEDSDDTSSKDKGLESSEEKSNNGSNSDVKEISSENSIDSEAISKITE